MFRNSHAVTEKRRMSIWCITAWASALYGLHVVGLTEQGLAALESHMIYHLRLVLRSYSQSTRETNQHLLRRKGLKNSQSPGHAASETVPRTSEKKGTRRRSSHFTYPERKDSQSCYRSFRQEHQHVCTECGAIFIGTGALRRHSQKHHPGVRLFPKGPKFDPKKHSTAGTPECLACGRAFRTYFFLR